MLSSNRVTLAPGEPKPVVKDCAIAGHVPARRSASAPAAASPRIAVVLGASAPRPRTERLALDVTRGQCPQGWQCRDVYPQAYGIIDHGGTADAERVEVEDRRYCGGFGRREIADLPPFAIDRHGPTVKIVPWFTHQEVTGSAVFTPLGVRDPSERANYPLSP